MSSIVGMGGVADRVAGQVGASPAVTVDRASGAIEIALPRGITPDTVGSVGSRGVIDAAVDAALTDPAETADAPREADRLVVLVDGFGQPVLPDLAAIRSSTKPTSAGGNDLTFTYDPAWSASDLAFLQQIVSAAYPVIKAVDGPPLFSNTVFIRTNSSSGFAGTYNPSTNEITISGSPSWNVVVHEIIHAFRDDDVMGPMTFEEGMTRAAEVEVLERLGVSTAGTDHRYGYDVYYEAMSDPRIGGRYGSFFDGEDALFLLRYQLAGYAWAKAIIENATFLPRFNAALYDQTLTDPTVRSTESKLVAIAASAKRRVEGVPFVTWYAGQGIFDTTPPTGTFLFQRLNQWTVDDFSRDGAGNVTMNESVLVSWQQSNFAHQVVNTGSSSTTAYGWVDSTPPYDAIVGYRGRIENTATAPDGGGTVTDVQIRPAPPTNSDLGVFGVVPRDLGGTVTVRRLNGTGASVSTALADGAFYLPQLESARGTFRVTLRYSDGIRVTRTLTKDVGDYFVKIAA